METFMPKRRPKGSGGGPCKWEGCDGVDVSHGYCKRHYSDIRYSKKLEHLLPEHSRSERCTVWSCENPIYSAAYCKNHYGRWIRFGKPSPEEFEDLYVPKQKGYINPLRLRVMMLMHELALLDIANELGCSRQNVQQTLKRNSFDLAVAKEVASIVGVTYEWLSNPNPPLVR